MLLAPLEAWTKPPILSKKYQNKSPGRVIRTCCAFGSDVKYIGIPFVKHNDIIDQDDLGKHYFMGGKHEVNGIIYSRHGGFIDIGHLRDYADWTAYLYVQINENKEDLENFKLKLGHEGGKKNLSFTSNEEPTKDEMIDIAGSIAYDLSLWHEIATYFGVSLIPVVLPEKFSSFSPEDIYSNLLGTIIGMRAIASEKDYETAVTAILDEILDHLGAVENIDESYAAMKKVEGIWWDAKKPLPGKKFLLKRNLDLGTEILPWLVDTSESQMAYSLPKPSKNLKAHYILDIKLNDKFPLKKIMPQRSSRHISHHDFQDFINFIKYADEKEENRKKALALKRARKKYTNLMKIINNDGTRSSK